MKTKPGTITLEFNALTGSTRVRAVQPDGDILEWDLTNRGLTHALDLFKAIAFAPAPDITALVVP